MEFETLYEMIFSILGHTWVIVTVRVSSILLNLKKDVFSSCHKRGTEKKIGVVTRNRTSDLQIPYSKGLRFNLSWGLKIFFWKKHLSLFLYQAQNLPSLLFLLLTFYLTSKFTKYLVQNGLTAGRFLPPAYFFSHMHVLLYTVYMCTLKPEAELTLSSKVKRW